jgi:predicted O-methyltransferase YrrM
MKIILKDVYLENLNYLKNKISNSHHQDLLLQKPGINHYSLLSYLSKKINNSIIVELGTYAGTSALALSTNPTNIVETYDLSGDPFAIIDAPKNIKRNIGNIFELNDEKKLLKAELIFLDTAHNGDFENQILKYLNKNNYKGILLIDDIYWNGKMYYFWSAIKNRKIDLTLIGHGDGDGPNGNISGTGIVDFNNNIDIDYSDLKKRLSTRIKISYLKLKYFFKSIFIKNRFKN